jgi:hypothetical protein
MANSGTGELQDISGAAQIVIDAHGGHTLVLDYDLSADQKMTSPE